MILIYSYQLILSGGQRNAIGFHVMNAMCFMFHGEPIQLWRICPLSQNTENFAATSSWYPNTGCLLSRSSNSSLKVPREWLDTI